MAGAIIGIGGGAPDKGMRPIDKQILAFSGKRNPHVLFVPTALSDDPDYIAAFRSIYAGDLGCKFEPLLLISKSPSGAEIEDKILGADVIYVGGGNTLKMMRRWRYLGVDLLLRKANKNGTVLAGTSAGCICWYDYGHSDSISYYNPKDWDYIAVKGMGLIGATVCPHYNGATLGVKREASFHAMMVRRRGIGLGIDNHAALAVIDGKYQVLTSSGGSGVHRVTVRKGKAQVERYLNGEHTGKLSQLLKHRPV